MADLIDRSALLTVPNVRKVTEYDETGCGMDYLAVPVGAINAAPAVDAAPVVHARWERHVEDWRHQIEGNECSACGFVLYGPVGHYCSRCGAKMDGGVEE